jgi:hypothetical protein
MIVPADDLLGHPGADSFASSGASRVTEPQVRDTSHALFTERYWYMGCVVPSGKMVFGAGLGYYANRKVMDGYAGLTEGSRQHVFCASRHCRTDPLTPAIGPLCVEVEEPLRVHRIVLGANESALTMDLRFTASLPPNDEGRDRVVRAGELVADVSRFVQMGRYDGWIAVDGRRVQLRQHECWGARDRSWGLRVEARTDDSSPPVTRFRPMLFLWVCAQFEGHGYHLFLKEDAPGVARSFVGNQTFASGAPSREIQSIEHDLQWQQDPHAQRILRGELQMTFADGERSTLRLRVLPGWFSLKAGMYGGYDGWFQGDDRGPLHCAGRSWDLADPATRRKLRTLAEQAAEFTEGSETGFGTIQAGIGKGFARYPEVQDQPFM